MAYNRYNSKRFVLLENTEPGIFESVRVLLEKNKPSTSIRLAFLSCAFVFAVEMHFANDEDSSHGQLAEQLVCKKTLQ